MIELPTPKTKWYVTEYPEECSFAITDGNEILVTIIGGNTIGDQCDLASRIAKLPDLERERDEAIDKYQSLQKTFEEWQLKFLSEQAKLLHNKDVERDKLFDEAYQIRIERDELREEVASLRLEAKYHDEADALRKCRERERDEARYEAAMWALQRDEAREQANVMHEQWLSKGRCCENLAEELHEVKQQRDEAREENKKSRKALEWIAERYDDSKPMHQVAMDAYEMSCTARAALRKEETK